MKEASFSKSNAVYIEFDIKDIEKYNWGDDPDISLLMLNNDDLLESDDDFIFYNQGQLKESVNLEYKYFGTGTDDEFVQIDFNKLPNHIKRIVFIATMHSNHTEKFDVEIGIRINIIENLGTIPKEFKYSFNKLFFMNPTQTYLLFELRQVDMKWDLFDIDKCVEGDLASTYEYYSKNKGI